MKRIIVLVQIAITSGIFFACNDDNENGNKSSIVSFSSIERNGNENITQVSVPLSLSVSFDQNVVINYEVSGTATRGTDFNLDADTVSISAGEGLGTINFTVVDDALYEETNETIIITLTTGNLDGLSFEGNTSFTYTIIDNDQKVTVTFDANTGMGLESTPNVSIPFTLSGILTTNVTFEYVVTGTAISGEDYNFNSNSVTVSAGTLTGTIDFTVIDDTNTEPMDETVIVTISSADSRAVNLTPSPEYIFSIQDNDEVAASLMFVSPNFSGIENSNGNFDFMLSRVLGTDVDITFEVSGGTATLADDYTIPSLTTSITAGETAGSLALNVVDDGIYDGGETVTIRAISSSNTELDVSGQPEVTYTILDNEIEIFLAGIPMVDVSISFYDPDDNMPFIVTNNEGIGASESYTVPSSTMDDDNWTVLVRPVLTDTPTPVTYMVEARLPDGMTLQKEGTQVLTIALGVFVFNVRKNGSNWVVSAF